MLLTGKRRGGKIKEARFLKSFLNFQKILLREDKMVTKSLYEQIVDKFTEKLRREESIGNDVIDSLKAALASKKIRKEHILKALKKEVKHENSGT